jgi:hypothetical protein
MFQRQSVDLDEVAGGGGRELVLNNVLKTVWEIAVA